MARVIDGKAFAGRISDYVKSRVLELQNTHGLVPGLATILIGNNPASEVYVRNKARQTQDTGMTSRQYRLPADVSAAAVLSLLDDLNADDAIHGILVQLPLPDHIDSHIMMSAIRPEKDVDGFHASNVGMLVTGRRAMVPCTPLGCLIMLRELHGSLKGKHAVVVGRSNMVGRPMAQLLLADDCTVTIAHRHTANLASICRQADILVVAVGKAGLVPGDWIKPGATVIDVGINRIAVDDRTRLVGDVDFSSAELVAGAISPVPGGVGPMTIACLLLNTLTAFSRLHGIAEPQDAGFEVASGIGVVREFRATAE